jgi:dipeptide/tripeptide permease
MSQSVAPAVDQPQLFGHPRGLATLFLTEVGERFTYYGMRAILILFMVETLAKGGLGLDDRTANAVYGLYQASTYLLSLFGGWIADRLIGQQRAVFSGGVFIVIGNTLLTVGQPTVFFLGLTVIALGVGLLKPNVSAIVAQLYPEGVAPRSCRSSRPPMAGPRVSHCRRSGWRSGSRNLGSLGITSAGQVQRRSANARAGGRWPSFSQSSHCSRRSL